MLTRQILSTLVCVLAVVANATLTGCSDSLLVEPDNQPIQSGISCKITEAELSAKFLSRGKTLNPCSVLAESSDFVLGVSSPTIEIQRVLERYEARAGVRVKRKFTKAFRGFAVHVDDEHIFRFLDLVNRDDDIESIESDPRFSLIPTGKVKEFPSAQQLVSSLNDVHAQLSSTRPGDGQGAVDVDIYILDTGIYHADVNVVERIDFTRTQNDLEMTRVLERFEDGGTIASDEVGHGTHVAGIAAAIDDEDGLVGIAPGARLHDFKVLDAEGQADMSSVIAAIDVIKARKEAAPDRPVVVNLSLGSDVGTVEYNAMDKAIANAVNSGVVVVVAAGNEGIDASTVTPAHVTEAITVGGTAKNLSLTFSNYGSVVDILAPGERVQSLSPVPTITVEMSGTSMAAPLVAGVAALYLSSNPSATPQQVLDAIRSRANPYKVVGQPAETTNLFLDAQSF